MGEIQKVVILGAGALGASYATSFFDTDEFSSSFIARDQRYTRLKNHGVVVNGKPYAIPVIHPDDTTTPADLIIVALKHHLLTHCPYSRRCCQPLHIPPLSPKDHPRS